MIKTPYNDRDAIASDLMPDLTPLLDVMFMLIVFFILTANAVPYALDVALPEDKQSVAQAMEDPNMISVTLLPDGDGWIIDKEPFADEEDFYQRLEQRAAQDRKIVIIGDKQVSMQKLMDLMVFLRKHNIDAADIMMERN